MPIFQDVLSKVENYAGDDIRTKTFRDLFKYKINLEDYCEISLWYRDYPFRYEDEIDEITDSNIKGGTIYFGSISSGSILTADPFSQPVARFFYEGKINMPQEITEQGANI